MRRIPMTAAAIAVSMSAPAPEPVVELEPAPTSRIDFAIVRTSTLIDPSVYVHTDTEAINAMVISDDELLRELAAMGRPAGLIRMDGEVRLTQDVVDRRVPEDRGSGL